MLLRSLLLPVALLVSAPALAQGHAADSLGPAPFEPKEFHGVAVAHGIHADVKPGPMSVRLDGSKEDLARVKLEVKDGVLTTRVEKGSGWLSKGLGDVRLHVTNPRVESVSASGGSHVEAEATSAAGFHAQASGGSEVTVSGVETKKLDVEASGGSHVTLKGHADTAEIEGSGGSVIEAREVRMDSLQVEASGGTRVEASPSQSIQGSLSGGSTVQAGKKPERVQVSSSGGSGVEYK